MHNGESQNGHANLATPAEINTDLLKRHGDTGKLFRGALLVTGIMFLVGIVGIVFRLLEDGTENTRIWGYHAAAFAFILTTAQGAVMVAIAPRMAKAHWRRPISRIAEMFAVVGVVNLLMFIPLLSVLPSLEDGRRSLWFYDAADPILSKVPVYTPHIWASLSLIFLVLSGLMLLWVSSLADLATIRDSSSGRKHRFFAWLANGWHGTSKQWFMKYHRIGILGAFYFMMLIFTHFLIATDFDMALIPGWIDALFPITHAANSLQAGCATVIIAMFVLRRFGGYGDWIGLDQFWGLGKLMFALSLLWFWFWFSSFIILWFGSRPNEESVLNLIIRGPYQPAFMAAFILNFIAPLFMMMWNPVRKSIWGPTLVATGILIGTFFDRVRLYVSAYSIPGIGDSSVDKHMLHEIPQTVMPHFIDYVIWVGAIGGSVFVYMLATRIFPVINIWEQKELLLYKFHKKLHRTEVLVLGKPD
jgi:Ni/Fe-hydrogenase subunit HybB-like protein|tara:strand:- start:451 stop:1869 length:1419 start_codon:yes stop_codon:yes gene_type:complete